MENGTFRIEISTNITCVYVVDVVDVVILIRQVPLRASRGASI
jgi:hypothetical protein